MGQEKVSFLASRETTFSQATSSKNKTTVSTSSHAERVEIEFRSLKIHHDNVSTVVYRILFSRSALVLRASRRVKFRRERKEKEKIKKVVKRISTKGKRSLAQLFYYDDTVFHFSTKLYEP